jgi:hypothetical protein
MLTRSGVPSAIGDSPRPPDHYEKKRTIVAMARKLTDLAGKSFLLDAVEQIASTSVPTGTSLAAPAKSPDITTADGSPSGNPSLDFPQPGHGSQCRSEREVAENPADYNWWTIRKTAVGIGFKQKKLGPAHPQTPS